MYICLFRADYSIILLPQHCEQSKVFLFTCFLYSTSSLIKIYQLWVYTLILTAMDVYIYMLISRTLTIGYIVFKDQHIYSLNVQQGVILLEKIQFISYYFIIFDLQKMEGKNFALKSFCFYGTVSFFFHLYFPLSLYILFIYMLFYTYI